MFSIAPAVPSRSRFASWFRARWPMARLTQQARSGILLALMRARAKASQAPASPRRVRLLGRKQDRADEVMLG